MPRTKKIHSEYSFISLEVTGYRASVASSINHEVKDRGGASKDTKVFSFNTYLEIEGRCAHPEEIAGAIYSISVHASTGEEDRLASKLDDYHVVDESGHKIYRKKKDGTALLYKIPKGIGHLEHLGTRKSEWSGWVSLPQRSVTDMLILLPHVRPLYAWIDYLREGKSYSITHFSLQTNDPAES